MKEEKYDIVIPVIGTTIFVVLLLISVSLIAFTTGTCVLTSGSGEGEWTDNLVYLSITENLAGNNDSWAKFRIETNIDFDSITNFSFIHYNENGSRTPRMALEVDTNNDGIGDLWVNQWTNQTTINEWLTYSKDDWYVYPYIYGGLVHKNLSEIQGDINGTVVAVKIVIGQWLYTDAHAVVISSVKINDNELLPQPTTPTSTPISVHRRGGGGGGGAVTTPTPTPTPTPTATPEVTPTPTPTPVVTATPAVTPTSTPTIPVEEEKRDYTLVLVIVAIIIAGIVAAGVLCWRRAQPKKK